MSFKFPCSLTRWRFRSYECCFQQNFQMALAASNHFHRFSFHHGRSGYITYCYWMSQLSNRWWIYVLVGIYLVVNSTYSDALCVHYLEIELFPLRRFSPRRSSSLFIYLRAITKETPRYLSITVYHRIFLNIKRE